MMVPAATLIKKGNLAIQRFQLFLGPFKKIDLEIIDTVAQRSYGETSLGIYEGDKNSLTIIAIEPGKGNEFYFSKKN